MINVDKNTTTRVPGALVWLALGEGIAKASGVIAGGINRSLRRVVSAFEGAQARSAARRQLYRLDDRLLNDIGLRRDQVAATVDSMFRHGTVDAATRHPAVNVSAGSDAVTEVNIGNDRHCRSAA